MSTTAPTRAEFIAAYPALATVATAIIDSQLSLSSRLLDSGVWGDFYSDAVGLDTAHNLTVQVISNSGQLGAFQVAAGPMTSASAAGMSSSFQSPDTSGKSHSEQWYLKTAYGQQFLRLRSAVCPLMALTA